MLAALRSVDAVVIFAEARATRVIEAIPGGVQPAVAQSVVGGDVHDANSTVDQLTDDLGGLRVRVGDRAQVPRGDVLKSQWAQGLRDSILRVDIHQAAARIRPCGEDPELKRRVAMDEVGELSPGETGGANDVNAHAHPRSSAPNSSVRAVAIAWTGFVISSSVNVRSCAAIVIRSESETEPVGTCPPSYRSNS